MDHRRDHESRVDDFAEAELLGPGNNKVRCTGSGGQCLHLCSRSIQEGHDGSELGDYVLVGSS